MTDRLFLIDGYALIYRAFFAMLSRPLTTSRGENTSVAWGITNNICSLRDLYVEKTDPAHPGFFLFDGKWEPARERREVIQVKGSTPVEKVIRSSRHLKNADKNSLKVSTSD